MNDAQFEVQAVPRGSGRALDEDAWIKQSACMAANVSHYSVAFSPPSPCLIVKIASHGMQRNGP